MESINFIVGVQTGLKGKGGGGWGQPEINIETNQTHLCCVSDTGHALFLLACVPKFRNAGPSAPLLSEEPNSGTP